MPLPSPLVRVATTSLLLLTCVCPVQAQVRRCTASDGSSVYTDRRCTDIGASERLPRESAGSTGMRLYRHGCARNLQDLVYELTTAIDARDPNRLAGVYHWVGVSSSGATALMRRLDAIANRPLVDIVPVAVRSAETEIERAYYPSTIPKRRPPVALRVEQTLSNGSTPSHTVFGLQRHFNCWWIRL